MTIILGRVDRRRLAAFALIVTLLAAFGALVYVIAIVQAGHPDVVDAFAQGGITLGVSFGVIGWLVASRRADNPLGWVYLGIALSQAIDSFASAASYYGLVAVPGSVPFAAGLAWLATWAWVPGFTLLVTFSVLLFPDGRLPGPRWRVVAWLSVLMLGLLAIPVAIAAWPLRGVDIVGSLDSDLGSTMQFARSLQFIGVLLAPVTALGSVAAMIVRFRRSTGLERQQLKWFTYAAIVELVYVVSSGFLTVPTALGLLWAILLAPLLPIAIGIAILRYRLYEIDRIISRTLAYVVITGMLVAAYAGIVVLLGGPLAGVTGGDTISVALSTLIVAALFQPLRRRVQTIVDRRFDRARIDSERTAAAFSERLRDEVDIESVTSDLRETVRATVRPERLGVWLRTP